MHALQPSPLSLLSRAAAEHLDDHAEWPLRVQHAVRHLVRCDCPFIIATYRLCLSISDFHPEAWNPAVHALLLLMTMSHPLAVVRREHPQGPPQLHGQSPHMLLCYSHACSWRTRPRPDPYRRPPMTLVKSRYFSPFLKHLTWQKLHFARSSGAFNLKDDKFRELFPEVTLTL